MKNNLLLLSVITCALTQVAFASDPESRVNMRIPALHPTDQKMVPDTFVPEFGYRYAQKASQENVVLGPCSPCVCMQICNTKNDECLYVHQSHLNDPQEPMRKVREHFAKPIDGEKHELDVKLFTNADPGAVGNYRFTEGSHKKRIENLAKQLEEGANVKKTDIYYNDVPHTEDGKHGIRSRVVLFKGKKPYRINLEKQEGVKDLPAIKDFRVFTYLDYKRRKKFADRVYASKEDSIWRKYDNELFEIKKPNVAKISSLPSSKEFLSGRYNNCQPTRPVTITTAEELIKFTAL